jgi:hypothetical protein
MTTWLPSKVYPHRTPKVQAGTAHVVKLNASLPRTADRARVLPEVERGAIDAAAKAISE